MAAKGSVRGTAQKYDELIRQVTESEPFRAAPTMRALLHYLWEHQDEPFSEYAIAIDALGRSPDFDPKLDSTVRVHIARLRAKLKEFYEVAGETFPLRLSLPLGRHNLEWTYEPPRKTFNSLHGLSKHILWVVGAAALILLAVCAGLMFQNRRLRAALPATPAPLPRFWQSFLMEHKPTVVVVPSPLYVHWPKHQLYVRDLEISDFANWRKSPFLNEMARHWGDPELSQPAVGATEMTAGIKLLQYLEKGGQEVQLIESRKFPASSFAAQNTIFLGIPRTAGYVGHILERTNFYIAGYYPDVVRSRHPQPGEPAEYREVLYSVDRRSAPAIIIFLPATPEHTRMLLLVGRTPTGMASMLVSPEGLRLLDEKWTKSGSPDAWEMIVQAEIYRDTIINATPVSCRPIPASFWK
jgi:hypothetical protein